MRCLGCLAWVGVGVQKTSPVQKSETAMKRPPMPSVGSSTPSPVRSTNAPSPLQAPAQPCRLRLVPAAARTASVRGHGQMNKFLHRQLEYEITALQLLCRGSGGAAHPSMKRCKPRQRGGKERRKGQRRKNAGRGGTFLNLPLFSYPSRASPPRCRCSKAQLQLGRCSTASAAVQGRSLCRAAGGKSVLLTPRDCSFARGLAPNCPGKQ